jgi:F-type H+-transporting ATPase subunit beta
MDTSEGLVRGQGVRDTGSPISCRSARKTLGRIMNVIGEPWTRPALSRPRRVAPSTRTRRAYTEQATEAQISRHRHQGRGSARALRQGGKIGLFGGAGVGKTVIIRS